MYLIETRLGDWVAGWVTNWSVVGRGQGSEAGGEEGKEGEIVAVHYDRVFDCSGLIFQVVDKQRAREVGRNYNIRCLGEGTCF